MAAMYRADEGPVPGWSLPEPLELGEFLAPVEDWRELASAAGTAGAETS